MRKIDCEVLVIGGGATGAGVLRDLAMRGFRAALVEKGDLTHGTTGRYHGLLHSGGRYVVRDPVAAQECMEENRIIRRILAHCIEDCGGWFVLTPWDDPDYVPQFLAGCRRAGIPVEEVPLQQIWHQEPYLNPHISLCYRVPDASADSFAATKAHIEDAQGRGALVLNYHQVVAIIQHNGRVQGVRCYDRVKGEEVEISADLVVNAAGAWAGQIAALAGVTVAILPGKGIMLAVNHRVVNTVINRLKLPSDGDILVPAHTVAIIGTTDVRVEDPDRLAIEPWEVELMLREGERLVPGFRSMRILRAWAGVRPLYQEVARAGDDDRQVTRAFVLLDHAERDGLEGFLTITGGKWTTFRRMAEVTVDAVCRKLNTNRPCRTHLEPLPTPTHGYHHLGARLAQVEKGTTFGKLICECELATLEDVSHAIQKDLTKTLDDVRREVRLGMGPCQGGFCSLRAAGLFHHLRCSIQEEAHLCANQALLDFLEERWHGLRPILWGDQLRQERFNELIYRSLLNVEQLPRPKGPLLTVEPYLSSTSTDCGTGTDRGIAFSPEEKQKEEKTADSTPPVISVGDEMDVLVIGGGLAGLTTAWHLVRHGLRVRVIAKGWGALYWHAGCVDVLGNLPNAQWSTEVINPKESIAWLKEHQPDHPYSWLGESSLNESLQAFRELGRQNDYPFYGSLEHNWRLPTAVGAPRLTCLAPETMIAGDLTSRQPMMIVGIDGYLDFYPNWVADNINALGIPACGVILSLPALQARKSLTTLFLAQSFEQAAFREMFAEALLSQCGTQVTSGEWRIGLPAILGIDQPLRVLRHLEELLGAKVFEIPTLPPSIPGMRLHNLLLGAIHRNGGIVWEGMQVNGFLEGEGGRRIDLVWNEAAARRRAHRARYFVLATGGLLGGGLVANYEGTVQETVFGLPLEYPAGRGNWFQERFIAESSHPLYLSGVRVNLDMQVLSSQGELLYENLRVVGTMLAGCDPLQERSLEGLCLASGYRAAMSILAEERAVR